ncbi:hypothetical protein YC2023_078662 [Brassica napus]
MSSTTSVSSCIIETVSRNKACCLTKENRIILTLSSSHKTHHFIGSKKKRFVIVVDEYIGEVSAQMVATCN